MLYLTNVHNYFVFHGNLGLVTQVVYIFELVSILKLNSFFISLNSTEYTGIFFINELANVSIRLDSFLIGVLFGFWLMKMIMVEET